MTKATVLTRTAIAATLLAFVAVPAMAATVVVPNINENQPGPSNNAFPFNWGSPFRYQQIYAQNQMGGLSGPVTKIAYRIDESTGDPFVSGPIDTEIRLSHTNSAPPNISTTYANNLGGDVTLVFDGILTLSSSGNGFDIVIDINDNFSYNGTQNLLVEFKLFNGATTTQFDSAGTGIGEGGTPFTDRLWAFDANAVTGSSAGDDGYVTQFTIETATSVEPTSWGSIKATFNR
jgi:hypothetical protein